MRFIWIISAFCICSIPSKAQNQKDAYKWCSIERVSYEQYPEISLDLKLVDYSKEPVFDDLHISENENSCEILMFEDGFTEKRIFLYPFFLLDPSDSLKSFRAISPLFQELIQEYPGVKIMLAVKERSGLTFKDVSDVNGWKNGLLLHSMDELKYILQKGAGRMHHPNGLSMLFIAELNEEAISELNDIVGFIPYKNLPLTELYYFKSRVQVADELSSSFSGLVVNQDVIDMRNRNRTSLSKGLKPLIRSDYRVAFRIEDSLRLDGDCNIRIDYKDVEAKASFSIPDSVLEHTFIKKSLKDVDELFRAGSFFRAVDLINERYGQLNSDQFIHKMEDLLLGYGSHLSEINFPTPFSALCRLEEQVDKSISYCIDSAKYERVTEYYNFVNDKDSIPEELVKIARFLFKNRPEDEHNLYRMKWAEAKLEQAQGSFNSALAMYRECYDMEGDEEAAVQIAHLLDFLLIDAYQKDQWMQIYSLGNKYFDFIKEDFENRILFGKSCFIAGDYKQTIRQLEWGTSNWKENPYYSWGSAFSMLQESYTCSLRLNEGISLNQRLFREGGYPEALKSCLLNLRLKHLLPFVHVSPLVVDCQLMDGSEVKGLDTRSVEVPEFVSSIQVFSRDYSFRGMLYARADSCRVIDPGIFSNHIFPAVKLDVKANIAWIGNLSENGFLVIIQLENGYFTHFENSIMSDIGKVPLQNAPWEQLFSYEEEKGVRLVSQLITAGIETYPQDKFVEGLKDFWSVLRQDSRFSYMVYHDRFGNSDNAFSFKRELSMMSKEDMDKSSVSTSFYKSIITYNGELTYDLVMPVFSSEGWEGALRIGIRSYY